MTSRACPRGTANQRYYAAWAIPTGPAHAAPHRRLGNALAIYVAFACLTGLAPHRVFAQSSAMTVPVAGEPFAADLARIDGDWSITFERDDGPSKMAAAELVRWGTAPELSGQPLILLADGGVLAAEVREIEGEQLLADSLLFGEMRLPLARLRGVIFHPPAQRLARDRLLDRIMQSAGSRDRLLLQNGDIVEGVLAGGGRRPVLGPPAPQDDPQLQSLRMQVDDGATEVPRERITAVVFNPSLVDAPTGSGLRAWVGFQDDGLLLAQRIQTENGVVTLTLPGGVKLHTDEEGFRESVQLVQPLGGQAVYLSDLTPIGFRHIPFLTLEWSYGADRNVLGGRLRSGGQTYLKGLGMHTTSRLAYRLDGKFQRFEAEIALDDAAGRQGSVVFRVYTTDAKGEWKPALESPLVRGGDAPAPISVDVSGAQALALIVEYGDRGDSQDYANWLDARLE